jgi:hypothetical protein
MKYNKQINENPFQEEAQKEKKIKAVISGSNDYYGACSLEHFSSASGLTYTHEDAQGFLDYPTSFQNYGANFWFKDSGVKVWEYEETYDNWQDTYGMDAVMVFYHSGHGNMDSNGVFQAPLGASWDGRDWAFSNHMAFANEELRYLYLSTCFSLRVSGGNNPIKTWGNPNKGGLRMLFGYETTSVDDPNYGKFYWEEWRKGKPFARSFLDASWRISHNQVPVVMASGSNQSEAINRLNYEKYFTRTPASKGWYQWQWIGTLPTKSFVLKKELPKSLKLNALVFGADKFDDQTLSKIAKSAGFTKSDAETILFDEDGIRTIDSKKIRLTVNAEGALNIHYGNPNFENKVLISENKAVEIAREKIDDLGFNKNIELKLGDIRHVFTGGGTTEGSGKADEPYPLETIVQYRQSHKDIESINSDHGLIAINIDNDGKITNIYDSTRAIVGETEKPRSIIAPPPEKSKSADVNLEKQFERTIFRIMNRNESKNAGIGSKTNILREKAGYDFSGNMGLIVTQRDFEVELDNNFRKRYKIRVPMMG